MKREWRWTSVLSIALTVFLLGIVFAKSLFVITTNYLFLATITFCVGLIARRRDKKFFYIGFIVLMFALGWWRGSVYLEKLTAYNTIYYDDVTLDVSALEDAVYNDAGQLTFTANDIEIIEPQTSTLVGQIEVSGFGTNAVYRGDRLRVEGAMYPRRGANQAGMSFAQVSVVARDNTTINKTRRQFAAGMQNALPEPLASFGLGLLIGQRSSLDATITEELIAVGLIHIVAVSGYNLTIITDASRRLFSNRSRYQTLIFSLMLIGLFLLMTGNSPSIVRAALVSTMSLVAWYFGRKFKPLLLLILAAAITAGVNPLYVWTNVGWYLSFTAFFGVLVLAPLIKERFLPKRTREKLLPSILTETTAAQVCTLPIILLIFGRLSVIGIVANLLVVPFVPIAMVFSLIAGIAGMLSLPLTGLIALPAKITLEYMLSIAELLSQVPHANIPLNINAWQMIYMYLVILFFTAVTTSRLKKTHVTITQEQKE